MKNFIVLSIFISTLIFGLASAESFQLSGKFKNYLHRDCVIWEGETLEMSLFTLEEARPLLRKKVISKNETYRKGETGRVIFLQAVGKDKFMLAVYFGNDVNDDKSGLTFYNKKEFTEDIEIVN